MKRLIVYVLFPVWLLTQVILLPLHVLRYRLKVRASGLTQLGYELARVKAAGIDPGQALAKLEANWRGREPLSDTTRAAFLRRYFS